MHQQIRDRRGRTRFHGAFTGGFSAGYFNTVGTKEGYKAKYDTWTSSRGDRSKKSIQQTPLDFMDDEDMATTNNFLAMQQSFDSLNHPNRHQTLHRNRDRNRDKDRAGQQRHQEQNEPKQRSMRLNSYANTNTRDNRHSKSDGGNESDRLLNQLFDFGSSASNNDNNKGNVENMEYEFGLIDDSHLMNTMGFKLLKKCGWRVGHRIGSKKSLKRLKYLLKHEKLYKDSNTASMMQLFDKTNEIDSKSNINENNDNDNDNENESKEKDPIPLYRPNHKNDLFGFGYDPSKHSDVYANALTVSKIDNTNNNRHGIATNEYHENSPNTMQFGGNSDTVIRNRFDASKYDTSILAIEYDRDAKGKNNDKNDPTASLHERQLAKISQQQQQQQRNKNKQLERVKDSADVEFEEFIKDICADSSVVNANEILGNDKNKNDNRDRSEKQFRENKESPKDRTMYGELPIDGFVVSTRLDEDYLVKQAIWQENQKSQRRFERRPRKSRFRDKMEDNSNDNQEFDDNSLNEIFSIVVPKEFNEYKQFNSDNLEIRDDLVDIFKHLDLRVGSFYARNSWNKQQKQQRHKKYSLSQRRQMYDQTGLPSMKMYNNDNDNSSGITKETQQKKKQELSKHLSDNFAVGETLDLSVGSKSNVNISNSSFDRDRNVSMLHDSDMMGGLKAGITYAHELPSSKQINMEKHGKMVLDSIRMIYRSNESRLSRFDAFIARKLNIDLKQLKNELTITDQDKDKDRDIDDMVDNDLTDVQKLHETNEFETKWNDQLLKYEKYLFPKLSRIASVSSNANDGSGDGVKKSGRKIWTKEEAAEKNLYGTKYNTRKIETWIPEPLLCKRMNVRNPFEGMYVSNRNNDIKTSFDRKSEALFGDLMIDNEKERRNIVPQFIASKEKLQSNIVIDEPKSKLEEVAELLENENDGIIGGSMSNNATVPPILTLKQVAPWQSYLMNDNQNESDLESLNDNNKKRKIDNGKEDIMSRILDITSDNESESESDDEGKEINKIKDKETEKEEKETRKGKEKDENEKSDKSEKTFNLFKSIFEDGNDSDGSDSDEESSDSDDSEDNNDGGNVKAVNIDRLESSKEDKINATIVDLTDENEIGSIASMTPVKRPRRAFVAEMIDLTDGQAKPSENVSDTQNVADTSIQDDAEEPPKKRMKFIRKENRNADAAKIETLQSINISNKSNTHINVNDNEIHDISINKIDENNDNENEDENDEYEWVDKSSHDDLNDRNKNNINSNVINIIESDSSNDNSNNDDDDDMIFNRLAKHKKKARAKDKEKRKKKKKKKKKSKKKDKSKKDKLEKRAKKHKKKKKSKSWHD